MTENSLSDKDIRYSHCELCPRRCGTDRYSAHGFCRCGTQIKAARAALHFWEEPCISGKNGSGAVFFSGCTLRCRYCQNKEISSGGFGREITPQRLAEIFMELRAKGAHNIELVTASQFLPGVLEALDMVRGRLRLPVVYNSGGYENVSAVKALKGYADIFMPDIKYYDSGLSAALSSAPDYFAKASQAVKAMAEQAGPPVFGSDGMLRSGLIIRHLVLPGHRHDSIKILRWLSENLESGSYLISLMSQYTPRGADAEYPELSRRLTSFEYNSVVDEAVSLGITRGYVQERTSAAKEYTPPFDLEGI
jgi:putative pyruvate formate lyase activating enzyme